MALSHRATRYLHRLRRNDELSLDRDKTIDYCHRQHFPITNELLDIQSKYSGYKLTIERDSGHGFLLQLFTKSDYDENRTIEIYHFDEIYVVDFGAHDTAPFHFYITSSGELCTLGHHDGDQPNVICSAIEKFIEQYALKDELARQTKDPCYYEMVNHELFTELVMHDFTTIEECSDQYAQWFTNGQLTIEKGTWLDRPEFYLHVYGVDKEKINEFVTRLKLEKVIA